MEGSTTTEVAMVAPPPLRQLMPMPPPPAEQMAVLLRTADAALPAMYPCPRLTELLWARRSHPEVQEAQDRLRHRLSPHMQMPAVDVSKLAWAEQGEARLYRWWRSTVCGAVRIVDLRRFVAASTGGDGTPRTTAIWILSHDGRTRLPMVPAEAATERLEALLAWLARDELGVGTLRAVRALRLLNNAHPFTDGNGRLGRALFNFCLHDSGMPEACFVPLKSLAVLSHGGYEIRLREAELFGRWDGLLSYHCDAIDLYSWLGHAATRQRPDKEE